MANPLKHKRNLIDDEWPEGGEGAVPAQSGGAHRLGAQGKAAKAVPRRRSLVRNGNTVKPDAALVREPAVSPKPEERHSQASSPEHLRKLQRLPKLRAPYPPKAGRPAPGARG
jgi:hypothetical protein